MRGWMVIVFVLLFIARLRQTGLNWLDNLTQALKIHQAWSEVCEQVVSRSQLLPIPDDQINYFLDGESHASEVVIDYSDIALVLKIDKYSLC